MDERLVTHRVRRIPNPHSEAVIHAAGLLGESAALRRETAARLEELALWYDHLASYGTGERHGEYAARARRLHRKAAEIWSRSMAVQEARGPVRRQPRLNRTPGR